MKLQGFILTDVAYHYYRILGKNYERDRARKNFCRLTHIKYDIVEKAIDVIYLVQKEEIQNFKKHAEKLA